MLAEALFTAHGRTRGDGGGDISTYETVLVPRDALLLVGVGVGEALDLAGLAAEEAVQRRADLVALAVLQGVALGAPRLEEVGTLLGVTWTETTLATESPGRPHTPART